MLSIEEQLRQKYKFTKIYNLVDYLSLPSSTLTNNLILEKKDVFEDNERIIFACSGKVDNEKISALTNHLQKNLTFFDIPNFFVLMLSDRDITSILETAHQLYSHEDVPISLQIVDYLTFAPMTSDYRALLTAPDTICAQPWISLDVSGGGSVKPCCYFTDNITQPDGTPYHAGIHSLKEIYNSEYMRNLRQMFREGKKPTQCSRCWNEEADGVDSKRQKLKYRFPAEGFHANYEQDDANNLMFISIGFGNTCNFKCRICDPGSSSSIAEEILSQPEVVNKKAHPVFEILTASKWIKSDDAAVWTSLADPTINVTQFDFAGGEPLLVPRHYETLSQLIALDRAKNVSLRYNTNGSIFPDKHIDLWREFKQVSIDLSIDNIGPRFEYERSNGVWEQNLDNLKKFFSLRSDKIKINLHLAISILNVYYLPEICDWITEQSFDGKYFSMLYNPKFLNISHITEDARNVILKKLSGYHSSDAELELFLQNTVSVLQQLSPITNTSEFCDYMKQLDRYRNEDFSALYPEIAIAMGY